MTNGEFALLLAFCTIAGVCFGIWQGSIAAGIFAGIFTLAIWRRE